MPRQRAAIRTEKVNQRAVPAGRTLNFAIVAICVIFVLLAGAYNYLTPAVTPVALHGVDGGAANPDESAHMLYVGAVSSGHIPVFSNKNGDYEAHQPPLYYILAAAFYRLAPGNGARVHCVRWAATLLGVALIWIAFLVVNEAFPQTPEAALWTAMMVAFIPMNVSLSSSVSNDTAANVVFGLFLLYVGRFLRNPLMPLRVGIILAIVLAAGVWTKSSTLVLAPALLITLGLAVALKAIDFKTAVVVASTALLGMLVLSLPWLIRNDRLYGDFFAQKVIFQDLAARNVAPSTLIAALGQKWYIERFFGWTFASYWGVFDSMNLFLPANIYAFIGVGSLIALIVGSVVIVKKKRSTADSAIICSWTVMILLTVFAYVQYNIHFFQVQGRYLYPALIPLTAISSFFPVQVVPSKYAQWFSIALGSSLILLNVYCLFTISGRYMS